MKKLIALFGCLSMVVSAAAQLSVRPNPSTLEDSYVYVENGLLYVEEGINLTLNNTAATEASIYLRGDSQLIQGTTTTTPNTGTGMISVLQQGFADRYEYNYWCSPVGEPGGATNNNFGVTYLYDVVDETNSTQALNIFTPDGMSSPLTISNRWVWKFITGTTYGEWIYVGNTTTVGPGQGFTMKGVDVGADEASTPRQEYDFRGKANNGTLSNPVIDDELTLIGNPYPSAVDLAAFFAGNSDVEATAFYWEQDHTVNSHFLEAYEGGYATWQPGSTTEGDYEPALFINYAGDGSTGPPTGAGGTPLIERRYAPIGQGFMVRGAVDGTVSMRNDYRVDIKEGAANLSEFKSAPYFDKPGSKEMISDLPRLDSPKSVRFNVLINDFESTGMSLFFHERATKGIDWGMDALSPRNFDNDVYWSLEEDPEDEKYIMQTLRHESDSMMVPLSFETTQDSEFRIYLREKDNFDSPIYLFDSQENTYSLITKKDYTIVSLDSGVYKDRFYITFQKGEDVAAKAIAKIESLVNVFQNNPAKQLEIYNPERMNLVQATLVDISGKTIWNRTDLGEDSVHTFPTGILTDGIYLLRLQADDNSTTIKKIQIFNR